MNYADNSAVTMCPRCGRCWIVCCEQGAAVELTGECIVCFAQDPSRTMGKTWQEICHLAETRRSALIAGAFHNYLLSIQKETNHA